MIRALRLSIQEQAELHGQHLAGDKRAKDKLLRSMVRFVRSLGYRAALRYRMTNEDREDLEQELLFEVSRSIDSWNPAQGTLRSWCRKPTLWRMSKFANVGYDVISFSEDSGKRDRFRESTRRSVSLDAPDGDTDRTLLDVQASTLPSTESLVDRRLKKELFSSFLQRLPPRHASVLQKRWLSGTDIEVPLSELGLAMNISKERVRQIEEQAVEKMRKMISFDVWKNIRGSGAAMPVREVEEKHSKDSTSGRVLHVLRHGKTIKHSVRDLEWELEMPRYQIYPALSRLVKEGFAERIDYATYVAVSS